jgi:hypothetical protein
MLLSQGAECAKAGEMNELQARRAEVSTGFSTGSVDMIEDSLLAILG